MLLQLAMVVDWSVWFSRLFSCPTSSNGRCVCACRFVGSQRIPGPRRGWQLRFVARLERPSTLTRLQRKRERFVAFSNTLRGGGSNGASVTSRKREEKQSEFQLLASLSEATSSVNQLLQKLVNVKSNDGSGGGIFGVANAKAKAKATAKPKAVSKAKAKAKANSKSEGGDDTHPSNVDQSRLLLDAVERTLARARKDPPKMLQKLEQLTKVAKDGKLKPPSDKPVVNASEKESLPTWAQVATSGGSSVEKRDITANAVPVLDRQFWPVGAVREFGEVIKDLEAGKVPGGCVAVGPSMEKANYAWDLVVSHGLSLTFACVVEGISQDESGDFSLVSLPVVGRTIGRRAFVKLAVVTLGATSAVLPTACSRLLRLGGK